MVNVRADREAHCKALVGVLAPREDENGKAWAGFIEFDSLKAHVMVQDGNKGKSINIVHNLLDGWKREWALAKMVVAHTEVGNKSDLIVFLRDGESLCGPFRIIGALEDSNVTEAFNFSLEKGKKQMQNLIWFAMIGLGIWISKFEMDWFARKFAKLAGK